MEEDESEDEALPHPYKRADKCLRVELRPGDLEKRRRGREGSEGEVEEQLSFVAAGGEATVRWAAQRRCGEAERRGAGR